MNRPFAKLVLRALWHWGTNEDPNKTMGQVAEEWGEPIERVMDAMDAAKLVRYLRKEDKNPPYFPYDPLCDAWILGQNKAR